MTFRVLIIDEAGEIHKISCSKYDRIVNGFAAIFGFASQTVRVAKFWGKSEGRKFHEVESVEYTYLRFDAEGKFDEEFARQRLRSLANLISLENRESDFEFHRKKFGMKKHADKYQWKPSSSDENRLMDLVLFT